MMGCADVVPGVSGGTVAFVTGIYDRMIAAVHSLTIGGCELLRLRPWRAVAAVDFAFLAPMLLGFAAALISMARVITWCQAEHPVPTSAACLGMMIASTFIVAREIKGWKLTDYTLCAALVALVYKLILYQHAVLAFKLENSLDEIPPLLPTLIITGASIAVFTLLLVLSRIFPRLPVDKYIQVFLCAISTVLAYKLTNGSPADSESSARLLFMTGVVAATALLLPGLSASFLLLLMGQYAQIHAAPAALARGELREFLAVAFPVGCGAITGLAVFSWLLRELLANYRPMTLSPLLGLMVGTIHKLWPFREVHEKFEIQGRVYVLEEFPYWPMAFDSEVGLAVLLALLGCALIAGLERAGVLRERRRIVDVGKS